MESNRGGLGDRVTRRRALRLAAGAGAAAGLGVRGGAGARGWQGTPVRERPTLRVGVAGTTDSLDPHLAGRNQRALVIYSIFDGLMARDFLGGETPGTGTELTPSLATGWDRFDDLTMELTLREGVTFHDGSPVTAEDVKFSLDRIIGGTIEEYATAKQWLGTLAGVDIVDPTTLRLTTTAPDPILEKRLMTFYAFIVPRRAVEAMGPEAFGQQPIGTGPYRVVDFRPDDVLIVESHDAYWGGTPTAARIEFRVIPEVAARVAALVSGEIDLAAGVPPDQFGAIEGSDDLEVRSRAVANIRSLTFNTRHPALGDKRLRRALGLAIDRQLIIDQLWGGRAVLPRSFQYADYGALLDAERPFPVFDPARARALIAEAGYDGATLPLWTPADYYTLGEEVAQAVAEMWRAVGVTTELTTGPVADFWADLPNKAAINDSWGNLLADPDVWWTAWGAGSSVEKNAWTPENPRFNELGQQARSTLDVDARFAAYREMLDIWENEAPAAILYTPSESYGVRREIGWIPYSFYYMDFRPQNLRFD